MENKEFDGKELGLKVIQMASVLREHISGIESGATGAEVIEIKLQHANGEGRTPLNRILVTVKFDAKSDAGVDMRGEVTYTFREDGIKP